MDRFPLQPHTPPRALISVALATVALLAPSTANAAFTTFGSDLSTPATLDTTVSLQPRPHSASDTYLWNTKLASGSDPRSPADGQITDIKLRGCTNADKGPVAGFDSGGIEFQDLVPQADGSFLTQSGRTATGDASNHHFELPLCSSASPPGPANQDTVTDYRPVNLCTNQGDSIDFTDNGGFDPSDPLRYPEGVPYQVLGSVANSSLDSFILYQGGQEKTFSPGDVAPFGGFRENPDVELLLQATVATGPDATGLCPGGRIGIPAAQAPPHPPAPPSTNVKLVHQNDGVNQSGYVKVSVYCRLSSGCSGAASLTSGLTGILSSYSAPAPRLLSSIKFSIRGSKTSKLRFKLTSSSIALIRKNHRRLPSLLSVVVAGKTQNQSINLKI